MSLRPGERIGGYEIVGLLGAGGMGEVYRARDLSLGREVALKVVRGAADAKRLARVRREARLLAALNHPSVAAIHAIEEHAGQPVLVLELVAGETLAERLARPEPLPLPDALRLAREIAVALAAAHDRGIVHRDLKPANVKLLDDLRVKLLDFGLAKALDADGADTASTEGVLGTAPYMSPEQARAQEIDTRTDVWAFGCVLYELLCGRRPFANVAAVLESEPDLGALPDALPPAVRDLVERCLRKDRDLRLAEIREAKRVLDAVLSLSSGSTLSVPPPARRRPGNRALAAASVTALVLIGGAWAALERRTAPAPETATARPGGERGRPAVAVLGLRNLAGRPADAWQGTALAELLGADLQAGDRLRLVPGESVARAVRELGLPEAEAFSRDTLARVREHVGADLVVTGSYLAGAQGVRVDARVQSVDDARVVATATGTGADALAAASALSAALREKLGLSSMTRAQQDSARAALPESEAGRRRYAEGLAALRTLDAAAAWGALEEAARLEPDAPLVRYALSQAASLRGDDARAQSEARAAFERATRLPREARLLLEARYLETSGEPARAAEIHATLRRFEPDVFDHALREAAALRAAGQPKAALALIEQVRRGDPAAAADPRFDLAEAEAAEAAGDLARQAEAARRAAEGADRRGLRFVLARARFLQATAALRQGEHEQARSLARESQRQFEAAGDRAGVARALNVVGSALWYQGDLDGARRLYEQTLTVGRELGDRNRISSALSNLGIVLVLQGDLLAARGYYEEALALRREIGAGAGLANSLFNLGELLMALGELEAARSSYAEGLAAARGAEDRTTAAACLQGLADVAAAADDARAARALYTEALELREKAGDGTAAATHLALGTLLVEQGEHAEAERHVRQALEAFRKGGQQDRQGWALGFLARAQLGQGRRSEAAASIAEGRPLADKSLYLRVRLTFATNAARVRAAGGSPAEVEAALRELRQVAAEAKRTRHLPRELEARLAIGEILRDAGRGPEARDELAAVRATAEAAGQARIARLAR